MHNPGRSAIIISLEIIMVFKCKEVFVRTYLANVLEGSRWISKKTQPIKGLDSVP